MPWLRSLGAGAGSSGGAHDAALDERGSLLSTLLDRLAGAAGHATPAAAAAPPPRARPPAAEGAFDFLLVRYRGTSLLFRCSEL